MPANKTPTYQKSIVFVILLMFAVRPSTAQTNIIQIIADDLGWVDLSSNATSMGNGSGFYQTPNIDALAAGGMSFTSAYVQQSCAPTRAALFTGQYAPRNGLHNVGGLAGPDTSLLIAPQDGNAIQNEAITFAEILQDAGYVTAHIGKFHATGNAAQIVSDHGFHFNIGGTSNGAPGGNTPYFAEETSPGIWQFHNSHGNGLSPYASPYSSDYIAQNLLPFANGNSPSTIENTPKHLNDAMADATVDFLINRANDSQSFFVNVSFNAVHTEINSRSDLENKFNGLTPTITPDHSNPAYAGLLEGMDQAIGRIVDFVQDSSLSDNTIIVFISDNGGFGGGTDNFPLKGTKGDFSEGGIRVPLIFWKPGLVTAGAVSSEAVHAVDFYKTYAELTGAVLPNSVGHPLDGESFAPILTGRSAELHRDTIYYHFPGYTNGLDPMTMSIHDAVDGNRYKLNYFYETRSFELYDLTNDLSETTELIQSGMNASQFAIASCMAQTMGRWTVNVDADLPTVRTSGNTVPTVGHTPSVSFDLTDPGLGSQADGQTSTLLNQFGIVMNIQAQGQEAVFDAGGFGLGVNSSLDTGGQNQQRRINGSLGVAEKLTISFNRNIVVKSIEFSQFEGELAETAVLEFVSGDNPFANLSGYSGDGFDLQNDRLNFTRSESGNNNNVPIPFGALDQEELFLSAGTVVSITANPANEGGIIVRAIDVAIPDLLIGDLNLDGLVNLLDVVGFVARISSGSYQIEADFNKDGEANLLDVAPFIALLSGA